MFLLPSNLALYLLKFTLPVLLEYYYSTSATLILPTFFLFLKRVVKVARNSRLIFEF